MEINTVNLVGRQGESLMSDILNQEVQSLILHLQSTEGVEMKSQIGLT